MRMGGKNQKMSAEFKRRGVSFPLGTPRRRSSGSKSCPGCSARISANAGACLACMRARGRQIAQSIIESEYGDPREPYV